MRHSGRSLLREDYPELWVMDDGEYERAVEILRPYYEGKG